MRPCIWNEYLHVYCPGCGGTRSVIALLHGHFLTSLWYHPLVLYTAVMAGGFLFTNLLPYITGGRGPKPWRFHNWYLYVALGIVVVNCIVKNMLRYIWNIEMI